MSFSDPTQSGVGTPVSIANGGTGLSALGSGLQVLRTNTGADALEWATPAASGSITSPFGATFSLAQIEEEVLLQDGTASSNVSVPIPAGSLVLGITARVTADILGSKARGRIIMAGLPIANETFTIDTQLFTWKAARAGVGEVAIGGTNVDCATNIETAVNLDLATVVATQILGGGGSLTNGVYIEAVTEGSAGNALTFTEASTNMTINGAGTLGATQTGGLPTSFTIWDGTTAARFSGTLSTLTAGATSVSGAHLQGGIATDATGPWQASEGYVYVTLDEAAGSGSVRITINYLSFTAPTS